MLRVNTANKNLLTRHTCSLRDIFLNSVDIAQIRISLSRLKFSDKVNVYSIFNRMKDSSKNNPM